MKEGAKRHPPMFYTFDFFTLLDPLSYEHRRDGENPCLVVPFCGNMVTASIVSLL